LTPRVISVSVAVEVAFDGCSWTTPPPRVNRARVALEVAALV
jgi:hypothetical protein